MNNYYLQDTDGLNKQTFELDPTVSPYPKIIPHIEEVVSIPGIDESGNPVAPIHSFLDFGKVSVGGIIYVKSNYMSLDVFDVFIAKFVANPPITQHFYDARRTTTYEVILKIFDYDYNDNGSEIINWTMELINLGVVT